MDLSNGEQTNHDKEEDSQHDADNQACAYKQASWGKNPADSGKSVWTPRDFRVRVFFVKSCPNRKQSIPA